MKKMYSDLKNWNDKNYKNSFANLENDGYKFEKIETADWFKMEMWQYSVLSSKTAHKIIKESEKAIQFSIVNQYGEMHEMWFPKKALINY